VPGPFRRVIWIVLDSVGIGEMPDAATYGDAGSDTLGNIAKKRSLHLPNLSALGLANIKPLTGLTAADHPKAAFGRCTLASPGKDTTTGHWEMVGIHLAKPFPTFLKGFPKEIIDAFEKAIGRKLPNRADIISQQHQAARWTYIGSGMVHERFKATLESLSPHAARRIAEAAPAFA